MQLISRSKCVCMPSTCCISMERALLKESFQEKKGEFVFARAIDSDNTDTIAEFLEQSVRAEKDYLDGVGDTLDLCVIRVYTEAFCSPATMTRKSSSQSARSIFCPSPAPITVWTNQLSQTCGSMPRKYGK